MTQEISLTISLPNYNHGHYLKARLTSILEAMPFSSELIVVDDGSTDNSVEILESFNDPRLKLIKNKQNKGVNYSLNVILNAAQGKYITFLSADDTIVPTFFKKMLALAEKYPAAGICCSDCGLSFEPGWPGKEPGQIDTTPLIQGQVDSVFFPPSAIIQIFRTTHFWIPGHTSIVKLESIFRLGGFHPSLGPHSDWFLLHAIALQEGAAYLPETLSIWRQSTTSYTSELQREKQKKIIYHRFLKILNSNWKLRSLFRKSGILDVYIRQILKESIFKPLYWDLVLAAIFRGINRRFSKLLKRFA